MWGWSAATRAVYPRCVEIEIERKSIFWAWADQALHASEQDRRSLGSEEGALARSRICSTISAGNCCGIMTRFQLETPIMWLSTHSSSRAGEPTRVGPIGSERKGERRERAVVRKFIYRGRGLGWPFDASRSKGCRAVL